jgi:hypothetical protein
VARRAREAQRVRVSSPIGDLPFEPRRVRLVRGGVELEGAMGAWPARVRVDASDLPALARLVPRPAIAAAVVGLGVATVLHRRRRRPT